ncbi:MAG TPA: NAD(P)-dependent oxidoreductase, partial [Pseudolabrys sp.]|nr:NAD(P)-dependent oxidoreductase [Pseudolabrys sp.]
MGALARLPVFLSLQGRRAVLAGGSEAAAWKAELLSAAGASVEVFADDVCGALAELAGNPPGGPVILYWRAWTAPDLKDAAVAIGAFDDDNDAAAFA